MRAEAPGLFGPVEDVDVVVDHQIPGPGGSIPIRIYRPDDDRLLLPGLVYFHGGGWVLGDLDTHDGVARALASRARSIVVSVHYRLAPEHPFPAAVDDAWAVAAWVAEHGPAGIDRDRLAVGGDSAGGNLAAIVALRGRERGFRFRFQLLVYPVTDCDLDTRSYLDYADGFGLSRDAMRWFWDLYVPPEGGRLDPDASPLRAGDLAGVAPALVQTAEFDVLRDEGEAYAARLEQAGVAVTLTRYDGLIHGFIRMPGVFDRASNALNEAATALHTALHD